MATTRRTLFGALAAIPYIGRLVPPAVPDVASEHFTVRMGEDGELLPLVVAISEMGLTGTNIPALDARFEESQRRFGRTWGRYDEEGKYVWHGDLGGVVVLPMEFLHIAGWEMKRWWKGASIEHRDFLNELDHFSDRRVTRYMDRSSKETLDVIFSWRVVPQYAVVCGLAQVREAVALVETPDRSTAGQFMRMFRAA